MSCTMPPVWEVTEIRCMIGRIIKKKYSLVTTHWYAAAQDRKSTGLAEDTLCAEPRASNGDYRSLPAQPGRNIRHTESVSRTMIVWSWREDKLVKQYIKFDLLSRGSGP